MSPATGPLNKRIGRFEIQTEIGRGGFGKVFRAFDLRVGRVVAIKVLESDGAQPWCGSLAQNLAGDLSGILYGKTATRHFVILTQIVF